MDSIAKAVQRHKETASIYGKPAVIASLSGDHYAAGKPIDLASGIAEIQRPSTGVLLENHVIAFDDKAAATRYYDVLRNQMLHGKRNAVPQIIAVCSPTHGCGATVTAANLAFSFARLRSQRVALIEVRGDRPGIREILDLPADEASNADMADNRTVRTTPVHVEGVELNYLGMESSVAEATDRVVNIIRAIAPTVAIIDLPPVLSTRHAVLYHIVADSLIVVLEEGKSTIADVQSCRSFLGRLEGIQYVLNGCGRHGL